MEEIFTPTFLSPFFAVSSSWCLVEGVYPSPPLQPFHIICPSSNWISLCLYICVYICLCTVCLHKCSVYIWIYLYSYWEFFVFWVGSFVVSFQFWKRDGPSWWKILLSGIWIEFGLMRLSNNRTVLYVRLGFTVVKNRLYDYSWVSFHWIIET